MNKIIAVILLILITTSLSFAGELKFTMPVEREHSFKESFQNGLFLYGVHWAGYFVMFKFIHDEGGSLETYKENLFFNNARWWDGDAYYWNFIGHPLLGSQTYLFYRGRGYSKAQSFFGSFMASFLFESTIEIADQSFSFSDAIITPGLGFLLGNWLEKVSLEMINSDSDFKKVVAKIINPSLMLKDYAGISIIPIISGNTVGGHQVFCLINIRHF